MNRYQTPDERRILLMHVLTEQCETALNAYEPILSDPVKDEEVVAELVTALLLALPTWGHDPVAVLAVVRQMLGDLTSSINGDYLRLVEALDVVASCHASAVASRCRTFVQGSTS